MFDGVGLANGVNDVGVGTPTWQQVDHELRVLARDRGALDAREAPLLRLAVRLNIWKFASKVSLYSYFEDVLGYGPKVARDRVRVAFALEQLPHLAAALERGEHSYTAVRELTRVVVPETEAEWLERVRDYNSARVQELVSMHRRGDRPSDPPDFEAKLCPVTFELSPLVVARLRTYQRDLGDELGHAIDDTMLFDALLAATGSNGEGGTAPRAQVQLTICARCDQGFVDAGGRRVPVSDAERDLLECDAVRIGSDRQPTRATKDVTQATRRAVWHRDHNRCVVPGCRSTRHVDIHHVISRVAGGGHGADNLVLLCAGHHRLYHEGKITLDEAVTKSGRSRGPRAGLAKPEPSTQRIDRPDTSMGASSGQPRAGLVNNSATETVRPRAGLKEQGDVSQRVPPSIRDHTAQRHVAGAEASLVPRRASFSRLVMKADATQALAQLGYKRSEARSMVEYASETMPDNVELPQLIVAALRLGTIVTSMKARS